MAERAEKGFFAPWQKRALIWTVPVVSLAVGALVLGHEGWRHMTSRPIEAEVVRVYEWQDDGLFGIGAGPVYSPLWRYRWSDGNLTDATAGLSHPGWNFPVGTRAEIRYFPNRKGDVIYPGLHNWIPGFVAIGLALAFLPLSLLLERRMRRGRAGRGEQ